MRAKCSSLSVTKLKCLPLKNRNLKFFCKGYDQGLKEIPKLKTLIKKLLIEVKILKNSSFKQSNNRENDFIINKINKRNNRSRNLIFFNTVECESNRSND